MLRSKRLCDGLQSRIAFNAGAAVEKVRVSLTKLRLLLWWRSLALQRFQLREPLFDGVLCSRLDWIISFELLHELRLVRYGRQPSALRRRSDSRRQLSFAAALGLLPE